MEREDGKGNEREEERERDVARSKEKRYNLKWSIVVKKKQEARWMNSIQILGKKWERKNVKEVLVGKKGKKNGITKCVKFNSIC